MLVTYYWQKMTDVYNEEIALAFPFEPPAHPGSTDQVEMQMEERTMGVVTGYELQLRK